jgi:hypothetical protein
MSELRKLNKKIKDAFGIAPHDALRRAHFRMAMTTQIEKRIGAVTRFTEGGVFLGVDKGVHTMPKYNFAGHYDQPKWVLERLRFDGVLPEVPDTWHGSYEPIHVFPHIDGKISLPDFECVELFLNLLLYGPKKTFDDYKREDNAKFKKEVEIGVDILNDQRSFMQGQIQEGDASPMPKNYEGESPLMKEKPGELP